MSFLDAIWSLGGFLYDVAVSLASIIMGLWGLITSTFNFVLDVVSFLPAAWVALIATGLIIVGIYSVHRWIKHIEIGGNKV